MTPNCKKLLAWTVLALSSTGVLSAQNTAKIRKLFYEERFLDVVEEARAYESKYPDATGHIFYKEVAENLTVDRGGDLTDLLALQKTKGKDDHFYDYWLARVYQSRYEFDKALAHIRKFEKGDGYKSPQMHLETDILREQLKKARKYYENPDDYKIEPLPDGINTAAHELSPAFYGGHEELLFASNKDHQTENQKEKILYDFYHTVKDENGWGAPTKISSLGRVPYEKTKIEVIDEKNRLYIYSDKRGGDLFYSTYKNGEWGRQKEFNSQIRKQHIGAHFYINDAEDLILFAAGEEGNHDIWQTRLKNGKWTNPEPLKGLLNSMFDDDNPFMSHSGDKLYFSSNRPEAIGGYDVFVSEWDSRRKEWGIAHTLGFPINTIDDDINFEVLPGDKSGYLSSNRLHSKGGYDIYYFHEITTIPVAGVVKGKDGQPLQGVKVKFHPVEYDDEAFIAVTDAGGNYKADVMNREKFRVEVVDEYGDVLYETQYGSFGSPTAKELRFDVATAPQAMETTTMVEEDTKVGAEESIAKRDGVVVDAKGAKEIAGDKPGAPSPKMMEAIVKAKSILKDQVIYFPFASDGMKNTSDKSLSNIVEQMKAFKDIQITVIGHTDNVGGDAYNQELSEQRAEAVKQALVDAGIEANRIITKGYGESKPVADNTSDSGRAKNRRIEIKVKD